MAVSMAGRTLRWPMDHNRASRHDVSTFHWTPIPRITVFHLEIATKVVLKLQLQKKIYITLFSDYRSINKETNFKLTNCYVLIDWEHT